MERKIMEKNLSGPSSEENRVFVFEAQSGMVLSRDVIAPDGFLVATAETRVDIDMISKISSHHVLEIFVYKEIVQPPAKHQPPKVQPDNKTTYFEKIRQSEDFKKFQKQYDSTVDDLKDHLNDIVVRSAEIDTSMLMEHTKSIMANHSSNLGIFDMLHSLRMHGDMTYTHSVNVSLISAIIGQWLHFSDDDVNVLATCGLLHDIGKLTIDEKILNKPGKLTPEEFEIIKTHVKGGYQRIKDADIDERIKEACLLHHEKCDGSGYPFGLKSSQIPAFTKIVTIADIYDAMTANRIYRGAVCPFDVIHIMEKDAFSTLDPTFALPFLKNVVSSYIHTNVKLSNGQIGEVILLNDRDLSRPIIKCDDEFIDLSKSPGVTITAIM